jgi:hypothetical protein
LQCNQWATAWVDGRSAGGHPLFRKPNGDAQRTGWTGYDCSTPICTQAVSFALVGSHPPTLLGGHGPNGTLPCTSVRCPAYDTPYITTNGESFQSGCGADPIDTGCCVVSPTTGRVRCMKCALPVHTPHNLTCADSSTAASTVGAAYATEDLVPATFRGSDGHVRWCGAIHCPYPYYVDDTPDRDHALFSPDLAWSNVTAPRFLCNVAQWEQGTFDGSAPQTPELVAAVASGVGSDWPLEAGRSARANFPNYRKVCVCVFVRLHVCTSVSAKRRSKLGSSTRANDGCLTVQARA